MIFSQVSLLNKIEGSVSHNGTTASIRLCCCGKSSVLNTIWLDIKPFVLSVLLLVRV